MPSDKRLWYRSADVVHTQSAGLEWTSLFKIVHVACPHGYFAGCQGLVARDANAASKEKFL
eukprot:2906532-Prymnesium_polylepis.1